MTDPDPVDALLGALKPLDPPADSRAQADRAFLHHAEQSKKPTASVWRAWSRWLEPALVGFFVLVFLVWAFRYVFGG